MLPILTLVALLGCGGGASPADRSAEMAGWLGAARGVARVWTEGSVSTSYADSNLESTEMMLRRESQGSPPLDAATLARVQHAADAIATLRVALREGHREKVQEHAGRLEALATEMAAASRQGGGP